MLFMTNNDLNWTVRTENTQTASGIILDKIAIVREDTNKVIGVHGNGYQPFQNHELFELLHKVTQSTGLEVVNVGLFGLGEKVFVQMKSNDLTIQNVGGKLDKVEGFVTGCNSFDGSTSLGFGHSNITISCTNSFHKSLKTLEKVKHTKNMFIKIEDVLKRIDSSLLEETQTFEVIKRMTENPFTVEMENKVKHILFDVPMKDDLKGDEVSTTKKNKIITFEDSLHTEVLEKGSTMWGLFSGVTHYTTHEIKGGNSTENKMFGLVGDREKQIFNMFSDLVMN